MEEEKEEEEEEEEDLLFHVFSSFSLLFFSIFFSVFSGMGEGGTEQIQKIRKTGKLKNLKVEICPSQLSALDFCPCRQGARHSYRCLV